jgi:metal-responsive CopG/Arc/MetJ family transcriptional regulator
MKKDGNENVITNIMLPKDVWEEAKIRGVLGKMSLSEVIRKALIEYLIKHDPEIKKRRGKDFGAGRLLKKA